MTAVHVQLREDAELGAAWRRAEAALPATAWLDALQRTSYDDDAPWEAVACGPIPTGIDIVASQMGDTPADALNALADALEARRAAE